MPTYRNRVSAALAHVSGGKDPYKNDDRWQRVDEADEADAETTAEPGDDAPPAKTPRKRTHRS